MFKLYRIYWLLLQFVIGILAATEHACACETLEQQLVREAPGILNQLRQSGCKNVGVLKFRVRKGDQPASDCVGTLNMDLADRVELALILANDVRNPVGVVRDASSIAANIPSANHLTTQGRLKFFERKYPLAWGVEYVIPDAFLVGVAEFSASNSEVLVGIAVFRRDSLELRKVCQITAAPTLSELGEAGESFTLRAFDVRPTSSQSNAQTPVREESESRPDAVSLNDDESKHPLSPRNNKAQIQLQVQYDGVEVPMEFSNGEARIPEPQEGQQVKFKIARRITDEKRYAVVLKINGENTIARQRLKDFECRKWILSAASPPIMLRGFQMDDASAQAFRVLSSRDSGSRAIDYGRDVGMISVTVFKEREIVDSDSGKETANDEAEDFAILTRGAFPIEPAGSLIDLREKLERRPANLELRGLIVQGDSIEQKSTRASFNADPDPVMAASIRYYGTK